MLHTARGVGERLTCADCGASTVEDVRRCPECGSPRLQGPPDVYSRPWVLGLAGALVGGALLLLSLYALVVPLSMLAGNGISLPGAEGRRARSLDRQLDALRDAERSVPLYPGSTRVREEHGLVADGQARTISVCWQAPADFDTVRRHFQAFLEHTPNGWDPVARSRVYRKGRVYLAVTAAEASRPACAGTYQLNWSYQV
jgi:hypothetical protein